MWTLAWTIGTASALTSQQGGPYVDGGVGLGLTGAPVQAAVGGQLSAGWWTGTYDDQYSFGRYWAVGPTARVDWRPGGLTVAPMLEIRRGLELIVVGVAPFLAGGAVIVAPTDGDAAVGWTARAGLSGKFRRTRYLGLTLRLEAGVDGVGSALSFTGGALVGVAFARPSHGLREPEL